MQLIATSAVEADEENDVSYPCVLSWRADTKDVRQPTVNKQSGASLCVLRKRACPHVRQPQ